MHMSVNIEVFQYKAVHSLTTAQKMSNNVANK